MVLHGLPGKRAALDGQSGNVMQASGGSYDVRLDPQQGEATASRVLEGLRGSHLRALPPPRAPLGAVWEVMRSGTFQPYETEAEQCALEQAWGRGEPLLQLGKRFVHLAAPMRQVAGTGKKREVRRRVL